MKVLSAQPKLVAQVRDAIVSEIAQGRMRPGERVIQEQIAQELGVSRQPVQQALLLLSNQGVLQEAPGRGLIVAPMDPDYVRNLYDIRAMIEGLAFRRAAERNAACARRLGPALILKGRQAAASGSLAEMIAADVELHQLVHEFSRNPLITPTMQAQWLYTQRVMGQLMMREAAREQVWTEHEAMLEAVMDGDGDEAELLARRHIEHAAEMVVQALQDAQQNSAENTVGCMPNSALRP